MLRTATFVGSTRLNLFPQPRASVSRRVSEMPPAFLVPRGIRPFLDIYSILCYSAGY